MPSTRQDVIYGPQTRADIPTDPPVPDWPMMVLQGAPDGSWWYRWWDRGYDYVAGNPPARDKTVRMFQAVLPALLADYARCSATTSPAMPPLD